MVGCDWGWEVVLVVFVLVEEAEAAEANGAPSMNVGGYGEGRTAGGMEW